MIHDRLATLQRWWLDRGARREFLRHNASTWREERVRRAQAEVICNPDLLCLNHLQLGYVMNALAQRYQARLAFYADRTALNSPLARLYASMNIEKYIDTTLLPEQERRRDELLASAESHLYTKWDVYHLCVAGIWVGVDVYEMYLRSTGEATVKIDDPRWQEMLRTAIGSIVFWQDYFLAHPVAALVSTYDGYATNLVTKAAQHANVPVWTPNLQAPRIRNVPFADASSFREYAELFSLLPAAEQRAGLRKAEQQLRRRLAGEVGVGMPYSTQSAFRPISYARPVLRPGSAIKILIAVHEFTDAPHSYGGMLFPDFYEWFCWLGELARQTPYDWYVKQHPDHVTKSGEILDGLLQQFPHLTRIPAETSVHQLVREGLTFATTCYGTIGHEYPLLGVQVINGGYNPHIAYDFNWHAKSLDDYRELLSRLPDLTMTVDLRRSVYEFYYMYHYDKLAMNPPLPWWQEFVTGVKRGEANQPILYRRWLLQWTRERHRQALENIHETLPRRIRHLAELRRGQTSDRVAEVRAAAL